MDTCYRNCTKRVFGLISASLLFMSLFFVQSYSNLGHAAEPNLSPIANSQMQLAWWHGPRYPNAYYGRYYWGGWHAAPGYAGCRQHCFHNPYTGAIARCERTCW
ncbi:MAG: hypothetical protein A3F46_04690 [Legionellales bacterium RIFCSPHIGHO2_12_FULL_42_9]|nr:MAG: hypothetical protein A3F46_04690 [Legionellales bacterium RIFCSPHIGHO2_12_FULL_42_9]